MKLSDAKKVLSGVYRGGLNGELIWIRNRKDSKDWIDVFLTQKDVDFALRQLALKTVREKEK